MSEVPLRGYIDFRIQCLEEAIETRERLREIALDKAEQAMLVRLESMNEFRAQINRERGEYVRRDQLLWLVIALLSLGLAVMQYMRP